MGIPEDLMGTPSSLRELPFSQEEKSALNELKEMLNLCLRERLLKVVLFGSRARGDDDDGGSAIDVAVVVRNLRRELKDHLLDRIAKIEFKYVVPLFTFMVS